MINQIYNENCLDTMARMADNFIDLTVTSPPYGTLRKYKGYDFDFESIAKELFRVTKRGSVVVWVTSDATIKGSETGTSFKQALYFKEIGFNIHDTMFYKKKNPPPLNHNRYEQAIEYMFVLSKGKPLTVNLIKEPCLHAGKRNTGTARNSGSDELAIKHGYGKYVKKYKPKSNVWEYTVGNVRKSASIVHPAKFPDDLAEDHIISWSNENDIVYDPMAGSGTTLKMAKKNNRNWIGSEIASEYCEIIKERLDI